MRQDLRFALRMLARSPGFALVAALTIALGIGANTAIFSVVNAVLLKPLPYNDPDRLVMVWEKSPSTGRSNVANPINFLEWRDRNQSFERIAALIETSINLAGDGDPEQVPGMIITDGFFEILGAKAQLGRTFTPAEDTPGNDRVMILSHALWQRRFGGDRAVVGRRITMNNRPAEIVGVMPPGFRFPNSRAELWTPYAPDRARLQRTGRFLRTVARLKPGVGLESAQTDMDRLAAQLREERPDFNAKWGAVVVSLREQAVGTVRTALLVLLGAVGLVLLIACANVANLTLMRATAREREMAVRAALGATRGRIVRQLLLESVLLALAGGGLGLVVAVWATRGLVAMIPDSMAVHNVTQVGIDAGVLGFTVLVTLATGILFGLLPALRAGRVDLHDALKEGARGSSGGRSRLRAALVVAEVALSMMLLVGAGLLMRSFARLLEVNPGFDPDKVLTMSVGTAGRFQSGQQRSAFVNQVLEGVRRLPEVRAAGSIHFVPLTGLLSATGFWRADKPEPRPGEQPVTQTFVITPGYFSAMGIPLLSGRSIEERDHEGTPFVTVINQELAQKFYPGEDPIGKRLYIQWGRPESTYEIVGVVGSIRHLGLERAPEPALFLSNDQEPNGINLVMRTAGDPARLAAAIRAELRGIDRGIPLSEVRTMTEYMDLSVARPRFQAVLLGSFALLALSLATVGIFGVISYSVSQRTQELGIRRALGAPDREVMALVLRHGLMLAGLGVVLGLVGALALTRFLQTLLFGVTPTDPATFAAVALMLCAVALAACWIPARRAARVDPMVALRYE